MTCIGYVCFPLSHNWWVLLFNGIYSYDREEHILSAEHNFLSYVTWVALDLSFALLNKPLNMLEPDHHQETKFIVSETHRCVDHL